MQVLLDEYVDAGGVAAVARQGGDRRLEYSYCMSRKACSFLNNLSMLCRIIPQALSIPEGF